MCCLTRCEEQKQAAQMQEQLSTATAELETLMNTANSSNAQAGTAS